MRKLYVAKLRDRFGVDHYWFWSTLSDDDLAEFLTVLETLPEAKRLFDEHAWYALRSEVDSSHRSPELRERLQAFLSIHDQEESDAVEDAAR